MTGARPIAIVYSDEKWSSQSYLLAQYLSILWSHCGFSIHLLHAETIKNNLIPKNTTSTKNTTTIVYRKRIISDTQIQKIKHETTSIILKECALVVLCMETDNHHHLPINHLSSSCILWVLQYGRKSIRHVEQQYDIYILFIVNKIETYHII